MKHAATPTAPMSVPQITNKVAILMFSAKYPDTNIPNKEESVLRLNIKENVRPRISEAIFCWKTAMNKA